RFARCALEVTHSLERFEFREVCQRLYDFVWSEFCDWYVEMAKADLQREQLGKPHEDRADASRSVLAWVLAETMKLLHPIMPSLTEEIWQALPHDGKTIMRTPWPEEQEELIDPDAEAQMTAVMDLVRA